MVVAKLINNMFNKFSPSRQRYGELETLLAVVVLLFVCGTPSYQQLTTEQVITGLIVAIPWDVANTLRAPIGAPVAIALAACIALVLLFGLLLSPVHYIFGYPSRIYHPSRNPGLLSSLLYNDRRSFEEESSFSDFTTTFTAVNRSLELFESESFLRDRDDRNQTSNGFSNENESGSFPDFMNSAFFLIPEQDEVCRKFIACHAHGFLQVVPAKFTKLVRFFSKRILSIPEDYKTAVVLGLEDQAECRNEFKCSKTSSVILKEVLLNLIPDSTKDFWKLHKLF